MNIIKKIFNQISKVDIVKNIILIAGGTAFAQLVSILTSPILTRIYSPGEFGVLTIYTSILGLFAGSESLRYEIAIPIADDDEFSINVMTLSFMVLTFNTVLFTLVLMFFGKNIVALNNIMQYRFFIPIGFMLYGVYQIFMMWNYRKKNYKSISRTKVSQSISSSIAKICFGIFKSGPVGLIIGKIIGESAGITTLSKQLIISEKKLLKSIKWNKIIEAAKRYIEFPLYSLPSTFLSKFATQLPILYIAYAFGDTAVGFFGFAFSIVSLPMTLVGISVGDVFYGEAVAIAKSDPQRLRILSKKIFGKLVLIGMIPLFVLLMFAPFLFKLVFGSQWYTAGQYARILAFLSFAQLVFQPVSRVYEIYEKQKDVFLITLLRIAAVSMIFIVSTFVKLKIEVVILLYVIVMFIIYAITYLRANKIINEQIKNI